MSTHIKTGWTAAPLRGILARLTTATTVAALALVVLTGRSEAVTCNGTPKPGDQFQNLVVSSGVCTIPAGKWVFNNVNIYGTGTLRFDDVVTDFYASSILIENGGSLIAGLDRQNKLKPIGTRGGRLTIHLYGKDQGLGGKGITCESPTTGPCGIPLTTWNNNHSAKVTLPTAPGVTPYQDYFYQYHPLPFDDGVTEEKIDDKTVSKVGYFGYKVLAVSYGGTLNLYGKEGATYPSEKELGPKTSGRSWGRLAGTILPGAQTLKVDSPLPLDWQTGDHIVVTSSDYLADHAEELVIDGPKYDKDTQLTTIDFHAACFDTVPQTCTTKGVRWTHNGVQFSLSRLPPRLQIGKRGAETRAAVGLLTRSIQIVSAGDTYSDDFYGPYDTSHKNYYFGGQVIFRQGFKQVQVQGVEFKQMGEGGRLGHYPVHFHLSRQTPSDTYVKDSSIDVSMTRWIVIHGTQGVTLARNVGYKSIGSGFYLEDGVETDNKLYSNLGVFARAGIADNPPDDPKMNIFGDNPRNIPGILASPDVNAQVKYFADKDSPAVFWITNGWNDFQGNMAAGTGMCGTCYWELPSGISGPSRDMKWESYASEQSPGRVGSSPLKNFDGNSCNSAMTSFQTVGYTQNCPGVGPGLPAVPVTNTLAPPSTASPTAMPPTCGRKTKYPICPDDYYPVIDNGLLGQATKCPATGVCNTSTAPLCTNGNETNCLPEVINGYTTSFNYPQFNFAGIWLRGRWYLVSNSFISDVQNGGLTFLSGGDYTHASAITGLWNTVMKTVFAGETQPRYEPAKNEKNPAKNKDYAYASVLSPFNAGTGLTCDKSDVPYCISVNNSFTLGMFAGFGISERMFNIYDGPANEDSNAFLDITRYDLGVNSNASIYKSLLGIPKAVNAAQHVVKGDCYIPNAAIAWKQPNGFYYPPTFHSRNLYFKNVDIRHYVIDPFFKPGTYKTDQDEVKKRYCAQNQNGAMFDNFTAIDRQTELSDDDGSLTGYAKTISVNEDPFFSAPVEGPECESDETVPEGGTARTAPYEYLTTVVYPDCAKDNSCGSGGDTPQIWGKDCANPACYGVPLYREDQTGSEKMKPPVPIPNIRLAGLAIYQRESLTVNHARYYIDTTPSQTTQLANIHGNNPSYCTKPYPHYFPLPEVIAQPCGLNVFEEGKTYNVVLLYASPEVEQTYQMYVGTKLPFDEMKKTSPNVKLIRVNINNAPFIITTGTGGSNTLKLNYDKSHGILTVTLNLSAYANDYATAEKNLCLPNEFCTYTDKKKCVGTGAGKDTLFPSLTTDEQNLACTYAGKDIDCPTGGCVGFSVTMPSGFVADDQTTKEGLVAPHCFPKDSNWNIVPKAATEYLAGSCADAPLNRDFCPATTPVESYGPVEFSRPFEQLHNFRHEIRQHR